MLKIYKRLVLVFILFLNLNYFCLSQNTDYNHYTPLKCYGNTPEDFLKPSLVKYKNEVADITKNTSKKDRILQKEFSLVNNYRIDEILMSGKVQYGNNVSNYINAVAAKLLANEPSLKGKMRFYLYNVPFANAFATNNGIVMVTTGLMAQLENEAQLAFVLAHEISHYKLGHSFESYKKTKDILSGKKYDDLGTDEKLVKILKYSKEHEAEADVEGLKILGKAGYEKNEAIKMMDILLYSYLPFDEISFPKHFFNDSFYTIPPSYYPDSATEISAVEDEDDEENSHPNIDFRKSNLEKFIRHTDKGELNFIGVEKFNDVIKNCRYELGYLYLLKGSFVKSFYNAFLLSQIYGESKYTSDLIIGSMYGMNKYKHVLAKYDDYEIKSDEKGFEGEISIPYFLFMSMKTDEFNILAAKTIAIYSKKFPSKYGYNVLSDVFIDLFYENKMASTEFNLLPTVIVQDDTLKATELDIKNKYQATESTSKSTISTKVKKIKRTRKIAIATSTLRYYKNAFITQFKLNDFVSFYDSIALVVKKIKVKEEELGLSELRSEPERRNRQFLTDELKIQKRKGKNLGIDSIIIIAPSYSAVYWDPEEIDAKKDEVSDEKKSIEITNYTEDLAKKYDLNINLIDINNRVSLNSDKLNQYATVSNWIYEKYSHVDKNDFLFSQIFMDSMIQKDGYKNALLMGYSYSSRRHVFNATAVAVSVLIWPASPLILGYSVDSDKKLNYFSAVLDLQTGEQKMISFHTFHRRPKAKILKLQLAYTLFQIKSKSKSKK